MKKRKRKKSKTFFGLFVLFCILAAIQNHFQHKTQEPLMQVDPFAAVKQYRPQLQSELEKYHLEKYTDVLLALMQQESHGHGGDPMQASESAGLARNTIQDPKQSIQAGVKHFHRVLTYGNQQKVDFPTVIQAYNMGSGYITFVAKHGGKHSEELAKQFSQMQVKKQPELYNCNGNKSNFRYPYCYGDFTYSTKVLNNMQLLVDSVTVNGDGKKNTGESF